MDNPVAVLRFVFVALFIGTDIVHRLQSSEAFLTPKQVSTTFLCAAILGLMAAGQTLVMLTGGVDLSVATTATTAAFMISSFATHGAAVAIVVALVVGLGVGLVNGVGVAIFRVNPLIMTLGISLVTLGDRGRVPGDPSDPLRADHPRARGALRPLVACGVANRAVICEGIRSGSMSICATGTPVSSIRRVQTTRGTPALRTGATWRRLHGAPTRGLGHEPERAVLRLSADRVVVLADTGGATSP